MTICGCSAEKSAEQPIESVPPETEIFTEKTEPLPDYSSLMECIYYNEDMFHIYTNTAENYGNGKKILCGTAPHHLTAGRMIAGFYEAAAESRNDVETVVICAPLHYVEKGSTCTTDTGWNTAFGPVHNDKELSQLLVSQLGADVNKELMEYDHAISSHIPFVKYYFPDAKTVSLLISPAEDKDFPERLSETLYEMSEMKNCLFVFSIDFSHYLEPMETESCDRETLEAVLSGDTDTIEKMGNDNVDTPYGLSTFVKLSHKLNGNITCADNIHTQNILGIPYNENDFPEGLTSYFVFLTS